MMALTRLRLRLALGWGRPRARVRVLREVDSTNLRLKTWARAGAVQAPFLLMADRQTAGRGRLGRKFVSPPGTGLYMSLLLRPEKGADAARLTILAAVAVCRALEELTPLRPRIKWVNDVFVGGKKVCGILAEGVGDQAVVGIGVNLRTPLGGFPPEAAIAGALDCPISREKLAGRIAGYMLAGARRLGDPAVIEAYRARMPLVGRDILFTKDGQEKNARVVGVDEAGGLMVQGPDGPETIRCGEISLGSQAFEGLL